MKSFSIGSTVTALDETGHRVVCKVIHLCDVDGMTHAILLPTDGGYSFSRGLATLGEPEADRVAKTEPAKAA